MKRTLYLLFVLSIAQLGAGDTLSLSDYYNLTEIGASKGRLTDNLEAVGDKFGDKSFASNADLLNSLCYVTRFRKIVKTGNHEKITTVYNNLQFRLNPGFVGLMNKYPISSMYAENASNELAKSRPFMTAGMLFTGAGVCLFLISPFIALSEGSLPLFEKLALVSLGCTAVGTVSVAIAFPTSYSAEKNFRRAIYEYNGNAILTYTKNLQERP